MRRIERSCSPLSAASLDDLPQTGLEEPCDRGLRDDSADAGNLKTLDAEERSAVVIGEGEVVSDRG